MSKVLVTGADGFIGSHLVEKLLSGGSNVRALVQYNSLGSWGWLDDFEHPDGLEVISGDIRDPYFCNHLLNGVSTVYHLAALIGIPYSYIAPESYVATNISGTLNLCKAAMENKIDKFVHTSTSEVYGTAQYVPIDEAHPLQPQSPYSASKISADALAMSFFNSFSLPVVVARPFNTYGPRQSARAVIPTIISQVLVGKEEIELGDVTPTRDFNYVEDTCNGFIAIANSKNTEGEIFNIGSNYEISIGDVFNLIVELTGSSAQVKTSETRIRPENSEVNRLWCDCSKLQKVTKFKPEISIREGLKHTISWMKKDDNLAKYKTEIYNV